MKRPNLYLGTGDDVLVSLEGLAVLMDVPVSELKRHTKRHGQVMKMMPEAWLQAGYRRRKEYLAATGDGSLAGALDYFYDLEGIK